MTWKTYHGKTKGTERHAEESNWARVKKDDHAATQASAQQGFELNGHNVNVSILLFIMVTILTC